MQVLVEPQAGPENRSVEPGAHARDAGPAWGYRAHLDGLRAVAVYLVVAFHAGSDRLSGGFIGVDVFFVLSGYLVTTILLGDLDPTGRVGFRRFYARRVRRLLPAAAVNLVVTAAVFAAIATPAELASAVESIRAAALYFANWFFIAEAADYFGTDIATSPVAHYWSLSVEEQFYLVWPVALAVLHRLTRRTGRHHRRALRGIVATAAIASLAAALLMSGSDLNRAYYGTDTRMYQLLAGALLALAPGVNAIVRRVPGSRRVLPWMTLALLGALGFAATSFVAVGPVHRGLVAAAITCGLIISLEAATGGVGRRALSTGPLVFLGKISYGTYLWHWIVILVATRQLELSPTVTFVATVPVATGLAALSYELLERPIRTAPQLDRARVLVIGAGLAASAIVGVALVPGIVDRVGSREARLAAAPTTGGTPNTADWESAIDDVYAPWDHCVPDLHVPCTTAQGAGTKMLLVGDSHAQMLTPLFTEVAEVHDLTLTTAYLPRCLWTRGIRYEQIGRDCLEEQATLFDEVVPEVDPEVVVLVHRAVDDDQLPMLLVDQERGRLSIGSPELLDAFRDRIGATVADLRADGRKVVIVEPIPLTGIEDDPLECLSEADSIEECRFVASPGPTPEERVFREVDERDGQVWNLDLDLAACPFLPICDPVVDGMVVRKDHNHLTTTFARSFTDRIGRYLLDNRIIE